MQLPGLAAGVVAAALSVLLASRQCSGQVIPAVPLLEAHGSSSEDWWLHAALAPAPEVEWIEQPLSLLAAPPLAEGGAVALAPPPLLLLTSPQLLPPKAESFAVSAVTSVGGSMSMAAPAVEPLPPLLAAAPAASLVEPVAASTGTPLSPFGVPTESAEMDAGQRQEGGLLPDALAAPGTPLEPATLEQATHSGAPPSPDSAQSQQSNFSSLISLLSPPSDFMMPHLTEQQQYNLPRLQKLLQGTATVGVRRNVGNFDGVEMACGMGYLSDYFSAFFAGLPESLFQGGGAGQAARLCGTCVRIWCVDSVCQDPLVRNGTFMVTDSCKDCKGKDLLVSARGFQNLTGVDVNVSPTLQIAWAFESCAPLIQGGIRMLASDKNNPTFLAFNFSNLRQLLRSVSIGGLEFQPTDYGSWELNSPGQDIALAPPFRLTLTGINGQTLTKQLRTLQSQDLGINFDA